MGKIKEKSYPFVICFITGLLWGVISGAAFMNLLVSSRLDDFYERIAYLENTITDKNEKLAKLEKSINNENIVLKDIEVALEFIDISREEIDRIDKMEIEKNIKEKYRSLLGKEIKNLDVDILLQVIDKRIFKIKDAEYQLIVKKLVLTDILKLWINVYLVEVES